MLLTQQEDSPGEAGASRKGACSGHLALVPRPFASERLVELNPGIQDDVLQVRPLSQSLRAARALPRAGPCDCSASPQMAQVPVGHNTSRGVCLWLELHLATEPSCC